MTLMTPIGAAADAAGWAEPFAGGLTQKRWLNAYAELDDAHISSEWRELPVQGALPPGLSGVLRRILAAKHELGGLRYHHWWDGDAVLAEFRIADGRIHHRSRLIETTKVKHERAAGRMIYEQFGTAMPGLVRPDDLDDMNPANVAVLDHGGELMALGDWCSAWRIDRDTLEALGRKEWSAETVGKPFSAHPKVDGQGHLWSIGYEPWKGRLHLYHVSPDGGLVKAVALDLPDVGFVHDFITTERHLVIPLTSTRWSAERAASGHSLMDSLEWAPELPIRALIVRKDDFAVEAVRELPPGMVYHYGNGHETPDGDIRFHCCFFADADYMFGAFRQVMRGALAMGAPPIQMIVTLPAGGGAPQIETIPMIGELPRIDERYTGRRSRQVWLGTPGEMRGPPDKFGFSALTRLDLESGNEDTYFFGHHVIAEEPAFAPRPGGAAEGDGWMVGTYYDIDAGLSGLAVFDAMNMAAGPIATAALPFPLPIGVHGAFHAT